MLIEEFKNQTFVLLPVKLYHFENLIIYIHKLIYLFR